MDTFVFLTVWVREVSDEETFAVPVFTMVDGVGFLAGLSFLLKGSSFVTLASSAIGLLIGALVASLSRFSCDLDGFSGRGN